MKTHMLFPALTLAAILIGGPAIAGPNINPGLWEFTTETEMQGAANMQVPSQTHTQCVTKDDLVPMSQDASQQCQITNVVNRGDTVSWKITCGGQGGQMAGTGQVTYNGNSMTGSMEMVITGSNMKITNHITGRRAGDCSGQTGVSSSSASAAAEPSAAESAMAEDAKDVGQAAREEVKESTIQAVTKGIRGFFGKILE